MSLPRAVLRLQQAWDHAVDSHMRQHHHQPHSNKVWQSHWRRVTQAHSCGFMLNLTINK